MSAKLHTTKGIVLRTVRYGETSVIVTVLTELFGTQTYLVNGVRSSGKKGVGKAGLFQPAAILELVVYHNELKHINRISEFRWAVVYQFVLSDVPKNAVALYMVELLLKCLKQPEPNPELFSFVEDCFLALDRSAGTVTANLPLFFALNLAHFLGFRITDDTGPEFVFFDLKEGGFVREQPQHDYYLEGKQAQVTSQLLKVQQPEELQEIKMHHDFRRTLLQAFGDFYRFHVADFGSMKTLAILREILK